MNNINVQKEYETSAWSCEIQSKDLIYFFIRELGVKKNHQVQNTNKSIQGG